MYQVKFTSAFKKSYKRIKKRGLEMALLDEVIEKLRLGQTLTKKNTVTMNSKETLLALGNVTSSQIGS